MARILSIDDDREILTLIKRALERDGHCVECREACDEVEKEKLAGYDLILLDIMMAGTDGISYCREIRNMVDCPVLFLTAKTMEDDLIEGFTAGADDYIKKPFGIAELRARVNAHLRREKREYHMRLVSGKFFLDLSAKSIFCGEEQIPLTKSEYNICEFLLRNKGQVFSLEQIVELAFGYDFESDSSVVREHIKNIRAKFEKYGERPIQTVWGVGYKWE